MTWSTNATNGYSLFVANSSGDMFPVSAGGGTTNGPATFPMSYKPTILRLIVNKANPFCNFTIDYPLPAFEDCDSYFQEINNVCNGSLNISLTFRPGVSLSGPPSGVYCSDQPLNFTINGANWAPFTLHYRKQSGPEGGQWKPFKGTSFTTTTVSIEEIFGYSWTTSDLNKGFEIGVLTGSDCSVAQVGATRGVYYFSASQRLVTTHTKQEVSCHGGSDGSITVTGFSRALIPSESFIRLNVYNQPVASGANFVTSSQTGSSIVTGLGPGTYYILAEHSVVPCGTPTLYGPISFSNPTEVEFTSVFTEPSCNGGNNGMITLSASGGTGTYEYAKGGVYQGANPVFINLTHGTYNMQVKDSKNCLSVIDDVTITQPLDITVSSTAVTSNYNGHDVSCASSSDGAITVSASGGTGTLQYSRDGTTFQAGNVFNGLAAGEYTFTVRDANNCTQTSAAVALVAPPDISGSTAPTSASCFGDLNGKITVTASGGTGALSYSLNGTDFQTSNEFTGLGANNYTVTIKDINACTEIRNANVTQPLELLASANATVVSCSGGNDGIVTLTATNGTGPYTYSFNGGAYGTTNSFTNVAANSYTISVRDSKACIGNSSVIVTSNPAITGTIAQQTAISCNDSSDGALNLTPGGGVGPYTYAWSNGSVNEDITALAAGTYTVTIKDSKNCTKDFNRILTEPTPISTSYFTSDYNGSNISCFGGANGSIDLSVTGGNGGYTYTWSSGPTSQDLTSLPAGTYTVTIKDSKNCPGNASVILTQPPQLVAVLTAQQNVLCFGGSTGSISLNSLGGTGAHEYSINSGSNWQVAPFFATLAANNYTILTRDINNCQASLNIAVTSPSDILLSVSNIVNTTCNQNNGSALASATGGVASYTYEWFNSGNTSIGTAASINSLPADTYRVVVTDQNACTKQQTVPISSSNGPQVTTGIITPATCSDTADGTASISITGGSTPYTILWPNGQTTSTATSLAGGEYIVEVRDNTSCLALQAITVPAPDALIINTLNKEDPNCNGNSDGMITLEATGGNGTYSYTWNTGATTPTLTNLAAGTYTITVKDFKNCTEEEQIILIDPPVFTIDLGADQKICEGMAVILNAPAAGTYAWSSDNGFTSNQSSVSLTEAGIYTLNVISPAGCEAEDNFVLSYDADLLKADFLMASQAHAGDTIVLIDISWPLPEQIIWTYDASAAVIEETQDYSMIRFDDAGEYLISLFARLAQCSNHYEQSIIILEAEVEEETQGKSHEKLFEHISAYPNPSPDEVSVSIELSKSKTISLELYQAESNKQVYKETLDAERAHVKALNLSTLPRGMYILHVRAGKEVRIIKIIKQ